MRDPEGGGALVTAVMVTCNVFEPMFLRSKVAVTCITATPTKLVGMRTDVPDTSLLPTTKVLLVSTGNVAWNFLPLTVALTTSGPVLVRTSTLSW